MTRAEREAFKHILMLAKNARRDLGAKAANGAYARPTVATMNQTLDRLLAIAESAEMMLTVRGS